jgi:hypothetical protein
MPLPESACPLPGTQPPHLLPESELEDFTSDSAWKKPLYFHATGGITDTVTTHGADFHKVLSDKPFAGWWLKAKDEPGVAQLSTKVVAKVKKPLVINEDHMAQLLDFGLFPPKQPDGSHYWANPQQKQVAALKFLRDQGYDAVSIKMNDGTHWGVILDEKAYRIVVPGAVAAPHPPSPILNIAPTTGPSDPHVTWAPPSKDLVQVGATVKVPGNQVGVIVAKKGNTYVKVEGVSPAWQATSGIQVKVGVDVTAPVTPHPAPPPPVAPPPPPTPSVPTWKPAVPGTLSVGDTVLTPKGQAKITGFQGKAWASVEGQTPKWQKVDQMKIMAVDAGVPPSPAPPPPEIHMQQPVWKPAVPGQLKVGDTVMTAKGPAKVTGFQGQAYASVEGVTPKWQKVVGLKVQTLETVTSAPVIPPAAVPPAAPPPPPVASVPTPSASGKLAPGTKVNIIYSNKEFTVISHSISTGQVTLEGPGGFITILNKSQIATTPQQAQHGNPVLTGKPLTQPTPPPPSGAQDFTEAAKKKAGFPPGTAVQLLNGQKGVVQSAGLGETMIIKVEGEATPSAVHLSNFTKAAPTSVPPLPSVEPTKVWVTAKKYQVGVGTEVMLPTGQVAKVTEMQGQAWAAVEGVKPKWQKVADMKVATTPPSAAPGAVSVGKKVTINGKAATVKKILPGGYVGVELDDDPGFGILQIKTATLSNEVTFSKSWTPPTLPPSAGSPKPPSATGAVPILQTKPSDYFSVQPFTPKTPGLQVKTAAGIYGTVAHVDAQGYASINVTATGKTKLVKFTTLKTTGHVDPGFEEAPAGAQTLAPPPSEPVDPATLYTRSYKNVNEQPFRKAEAQRLSTSLTGTERAALTKYSGSLYAAINTALRQSNGTSAGSNAATVKSLDSAMTKMRAPRDMEVYRGCGKPPGGFKALIGQFYTDQGFMSTSIGRTSGFSGTARLTIRVPAGTPGVYMESVSHFKHELEFLLARGTRLRILKVEDVAGTEHVTAVVENP